MAWDKMYNNDIVIKQHELDLEEQLLNLKRILLQKQQAEMQHEAFMKELEERVLAQSEKIEKKKIEIESLRNE